VQQPGSYLPTRMILVRNRNGTLYFLARDGDDALVSLRRSYPGRPLAILKKGEGLAILRVGDPLPGGEGDKGERLDIVNVVLPPPPEAFSFRA